MYVDFKETIILLMQHPIIRKPITSLTGDELESAYDLLSKLSDLSIDEEFTQLNDIQMARLEYNLGELSYRLGEPKLENIIHHYRAALNHLTKGGFNLSMDKWAELVSLRTMEY